MIENTINPILLSLGPVQIRWYGLMYVLGFLAVLYFSKKAIKQGKLKLTEKELDDFLGILVVAMIVGARLFYAIFYNPAYFIASPLKIFAVWQGGLSFHGAVLGMLLAGYWYTKRKQIKLLEVADIFIVPMALGSAFGRIGNFINGELYGIPSDLPFAVLFKGVEGARHPTQIYESLYNFVIFLILLTQMNKNRKPGFLLGLFFALYAVARFSVEFLKDLAVYGPLTMGQWLTIPLFFIGLWLLYRHKS